MCVYVCTYTHIHAHSTCTRFRTRPISYHKGISTIDLRREYRDELETKWVEGDLKRPSYQPPPSWAASCFLNSLSFSLSFLSFLLFLYSLTSSLLLHDLFHPFFFYTLDNVSSRILAMIVLMFCLLNDAISIDHSSRSSFLLAREQERHLLIICIIKIDLKKKTKYRTFHFYVHQIFLNRIKL